MRISVIVFLIFLICSCSIKREWQEAIIIYKDDFEKEMNTFVSKRSYYNFIRAKEKNGDQKIEILIPEEVLCVETKNDKYISVFFDEDSYGMESYSFAHVLAGDSLMIAKTKYQAKTCACKTSGAFFHGYFLVYQSHSLKIKTDNKNKVYNRNEIYDFVEKHFHHGLPKDINTIEDIVLFLQE